MGVPKFFRYISERYPCLSEILKEYQIPEFDNLYLDMNGIIHGCSHPNDSDYDFQITEKQIFENIFHYIEILFYMIRPQKLFFMAVDGVAPRAKINQQRSRRFRSAKEAEIKEAKAKAQGIDMSTRTRFDSNCITPGTLFMAKLNKQLQYFISHKISTDTLWQKCKIVFSGSEVPGEGEHKIMDYIRYSKTQPDYDPNTRHCLYGLDADLIMLGLCTHELHFSLLREEVKFGKKQKKILTPEETKFCLLHLSLLREYLSHEFLPIKNKLSFPFDIEKIIDDWVLMGFLVGNDFIPHLPNLHIANGALPVLYHAYMEVLPTLDGYINEQGRLNLERFEKFMERLSRIDLEQFAEHYADLIYFESKTGRRINEFEKQPSKKYDELSDDVASPKRMQNKELDALIKSTADMSLLHSDEDEPLDDESDSDIYTMEFVQHKRDYYMNKLEYENVDADVLRSQAEGYVRAIQWNLHYYYNGCCSWSWYYPHHYAPYISDIKDFKDLKLEFELGEPFSPFQQLLAVLPAYSKDLLPVAFQTLLTEEHSPIISYYPVDFKTDLNGKRQEWEAVVLIPFINEKDLLKAMEPYYPKLNDEERKRDSHGPMCLYTYTKENLGFYNAPEYFPEIVVNHAKVEYVNREDIFVPEEKLIKGLCRGVRVDVYFPGFPTLQYIKHTANLEKAKVKVFEQPSRGDNMILKILPQHNPSISSVASNLLGRTVYVNWPHLTEAQVVSVANGDWKISLIDQQKKYSSENINKEVVKGPLAAQRALLINSITETYKSRLGIDIGDTNILVFACPLVGSKYVFGSQGKLYFEKQWNDMPVAYAYQTVVQDISVYSVNPLLYKSIEEIFTVGSICFMLGHPHYGAMGEVLAPGVMPHSNRVKVSMKVVPEPLLDSLKRAQSELKTQYMHGSIAAQRLGISSHLLSRITGTIYVLQGSDEQQDNGKHNVGLNLKFSKKNEEVPGYTKKENSQWLYSVKAVDLIRSYMIKCPSLFEKLAMNVGNDVFREDDLFEEGSNELSVILEWLKEQKIQEIESRTCGAEMLDIDVVKELENEVDKFNETYSSENKLVLMQVKPHLIFKPGLHLRNAPPDAASKTYLFDRICCVRESFTVPLGYKGTIIGIQKGDNILDTMYDVLFDRSFPGGLALNGCSECRGYRVSIVDFINISHGERMEHIKTGKPENSPRHTESWRQPNATKNQSHSSTSPFASFNKENNHSRAFSESPQLRIAKKNTDRIMQENHCEQNWRRTTVENIAQKHSEAVSAIPQCGVPFESEKSITRNTSEFHAIWDALHKKPSTTPEKTLKFFQNVSMDLYSSKKPSQIPENRQMARYEGPKFLMQRDSESNDASNELQRTKAQKLKQRVEKTSNPRNAKVEQAGEIASENSPQDPSAFLKKMLKISDGNAQSNNPQGVFPPPLQFINKPVTQPQKQLDTPPLVQQLFDHARQNEKKKETETPIWHCTQLLNHFQLSGIGMPRYSYFLDKQTNKICARILLPDTRVFVGDPCPTHGQAAENAAAKVYKELNLSECPKPDIQVLLPPPLQWYNSRQNNTWPQNIRPPIAAAPPPPPPPPMCPPKVHHNPPPQHLMMPFPKWNQMVPQNVGYMPVPMHSNQDLRMNIQPQHQQVHTEPKSAHRQVIHNEPKQTQMINETETRKSEIKNSTSFVPLQAQKKSRNIVAKQAAKEIDRSECSISKNPSASQQKKDEMSKSPNGECSKKVDKKQTQEQSNATQVSSKSQKPTRTRRSRVAANFGSFPVANGGEQ